MFYFYSTRWWPTIEASGTKDSLLPWSSNDIHHAWDAHNTTSHESRTTSFLSTSEMAQGQRHPAENQTTTLEILHLFNTYIWAVCIQHHVPRIDTTVYFHDGITSTGCRQPQLLDQDDTYSIFAPLRHSASFCAIAALGGPAADHTSPETHALAIPWHYSYCGLE